VEKTWVVNKFFEFLDGRFPDAKCELIHKNLYELAISTILSAQCTDEMVNRVTPLLFEKYPDFRALALSDIGEVKEIIRPTGFYNNKAKSITTLAKIVVTKYGGELPLVMELLVKLPGIGRKTANIILSEYATAEGIVVDTHVKRVSKRLGLTTHDDPIKIEKDLISLIPENRWGKISHQIIHFGRQICKARKPECSNCQMKDFCSYYKQ
jgi:endonuclease-3